MIPPVDIVTYAIRPRQRRKPQDSRAILQFSKTKGLTSEFENERKGRELNEMNKRSNHYMRLCWYNFYIYKKQLPSVRWDNDLPKREPNKTRSYHEYHHRHTYLTIPLSLTPLSSAPKLSSKPRHPRSSAC
jgi:hypothetical protein